MGLLVRDKGRQTLDWVLNLFPALKELLRDHMRRLFAGELVTVAQHADREDPNQWWMESWHGMLRVSPEFGEAWQARFGKEASGDS